MERRPVFTVYEAMMIFWMKGNRMSKDVIDGIVIGVIALAMIGLAAPIFIESARAPKDACGNIYPGAKGPIKDPNPWCKLDDVRRVKP
jgi:hypothetical protein